MRRATAPERHQDAADELVALSQALGLYARRLEVAVPEPPSLNHAYATVNGRRVLSRDGRAFKEGAALIIRAAAAAQGFTVPPRAPLRLGFRFYFRNPARDGSNAVKLIEDAAGEALGFNDKFVVAQWWTKAIDRAEPRAELVLEVLE